MKNLLYKVYAFIFNFCTLFPTKRGRVALLSPHMACFTDSLGEIEKELALRKGYRTFRISGTDIKPSKPKNLLDAFKNIGKMISFFTRKAYLLATSQMIFLNDNFMPMADMKLKKNTVVVQLWHGEGAFKKIQLDLNLADSTRERVKKINSKLDYVICSSQNLVELYAHAFGVPVEKILPFGSPRADRYLEVCRSKEFDREGFRNKHFGGNDKTVVLYAPTFRDDAADNAQLLTHFDFERFDRLLGDRFTLVLRLHPQIHSGIAVPDGVIDMTEYKNVNDLIQSTDILITDYSSVCMDFALVGKPCVFYAFDLEKYSRERQLYCGYKGYVPGLVAETFDELISAVENAEDGTKELKRFVEFNFSGNDGKSSKKIVDAAVKKLDNK